MDFIDHGHGFASQDYLELEKEEYNHGITYSIAEKLRNAWRSHFIDNEDNYELILSEKELSYIHDLIKNTLIEDFGSFESDPELLGLLEITNDIFNKFGKDTLTISQIEEFYYERYPDCKLKKTI